MRSWSSRLFATCFAAVTALSFLPATAGHTVTGTLPIETQLLQDEGEDAFLVIDGYDLWDLYVRETYWPDHGSGLTFRFTLYGGFAQASTAERLRIGLGLTTIQGEWTGEVSTTDDETWEGHGVHIIHADPQDDISGKTTYLQVFVSYADLGAEPGTTVTEATMRSFVDDTLVDIAPGGIYVGGAAEVPTESERVTDELPLRGPVGYTKVETYPGAAGVALVRIINPFPEAGQHIHLAAGTAPGWRATALEPLEVSIAGGKNATFEIDVAAAGLWGLPLTVETDIGGQETVFLHRDADGWLVNNDPTPLSGHGDDHAAEASSISVLPALAILGLAAALWRRP